MGDLITIDIAGIVTALDIADAHYAAQTRAHLSAFLAVDKPPQLTVRVRVTPGARFVPLRAGPWVIETALNDGRLTYRSFFDSGWADFTRGEAALDIAPECDVENFLRVLYAHLCVRGGGLLLHAAGVIRDGRGFVFCGKSGAGKSTTAQLSLEAGVTVLSDDLVIVRRQGDAFRVYGVPFRGTFAEGLRTRADAELAGVYALVKDGAHFVTASTAPQAVAALARCAPFVMSQPAASAHVIAFCRALSAQTFVGELHFRKDAGFWAAIDESIKPVSLPA